MNIKITTMLEDENVYMSFGRETDRDMLELLNPNVMLYTNAEYQYFMKFNDGRNEWTMYMSQERLLEIAEAIIRKFGGNRPEGKWKKWTDERFGGSIYYCSSCHMRSPSLHNYCPNCGTPMEVENEGVDK